MTVYHVQSRPARVRALNGTRGVHFLKDVTFYEVFPSGNNAEAVARTTDPTVARVVAHALNEIAEDLTPSVAEAVIKAIGAVAVAGYIKNRSPEALYVPFDPAARHSIAR